MGLDSGESSCKPLSVHGAFTGRNSQCTLYQSDSSFVTGLHFTESIFLYPNIESTVVRVMYRQTQLQNQSAEQTIIFLNCPHICRGRAEQVSAVHPLSFLLPCLLFSLPPPQLTQLTLFICLFHSFICFGTIYFTFVPNSMKNSLLALEKTGLHRHDAEEHAQAMSTAIRPEVPTLLSCCFGTTCSHVHR